jgi:hypothetical protein
MKKELLDKDGQMIQIDNRIFRICIEPDAYDDADYERIQEEYGCTACELEDCPARDSFSNADFNKSYCYKYINPKVYKEKLVVFKEIKNGI